MGGQGDISVTANVAPAAMAEAFELALAGQAEEARAIYQRLMGLHTDLFVESSPSPSKYCFG